MRVKRIALLLAIISIFSAGCSVIGVENEKEDKKISLKAHNGAIIDCTPELYQDYLAATNANDVAKLLFEQNNRGIFKPVPKSTHVVLSWVRSASYSRYGFRKMKI